MRPPRALIGLLLALGACEEALIQVDSAAPRMDTVGPDSLDSAVGLDDTGESGGPVDPGDRDGDGVPAALDCDDEDASVGAPSDEVLDGLDNDCNGLVDDAAVDTVSTGVLLRAYGDLRLGDHGQLATAADLTGDGAPDLVLGSPRAGYGYAWVIEGVVAATARGEVFDHDAAFLAGESGYWPIGYVHGHPADIDGDGVGDLALGAGDPNGYFAYARGYAWRGGTSLSGSKGTSDAMLTLDAFDAEDFERTVVSADINGDGVAELILGAGLADGDDEDHGDRDSAYDAGAVMVFEGPVGTSTVDGRDADDAIFGGEASTYLGWSLAAADLDADGYAEIVAGAPGYDGGAENGGAAFLFAGGPSLRWPGNADEASRALVAGDSAGLAIGADALPHPGDVDGSGRLDLGIGAEDEGRAFLFYDLADRTGTVLTSGADASWTGTPGDLGSMMVLDSDLDGDGLDDVVIGADGDDTFADDAGIVYVFGGTQLGAVDTAAARATLYGRQADGYFGCGGAGGFDLDGDGLDDLVVGEWGADDGATDGGAAWFVPGW